MKKILAKLNLLINDLENKNFIKEADSLHSVFVKVAQLGTGSTREFTNPGGPINVNAVVIEYTIVPDIDNESPLDENNRNRLTVSNKFNIFNPNINKSQFNNLREAEIYFASILQTSAMPGYGSKNKELHELVIENYALSVGSFTLDDIRWSKIEPSRFGETTREYNVKYILSYEVSIYYNGGYKDLILKGSDYTLLENFFSNKKLGHLLKGKTYKPQQEDFKREGKYDYDPKDFPPDPLYEDLEDEDEDEDDYVDPSDYIAQSPVEKMMGVNRFRTMKMKNLPPEGPAV